MNQFYVFHSVCPPSDKTIILIGAYSWVYVFAKGNKFSNWWSMLRHNFFRVTRSNLHYLEKEEARKEWLKANFGLIYRCPSPWPVPFNMSSPYPQPMVGDDQGVTMTDCCGNYMYHEAQGEAEWPGACTNSDHDSGMALGPKKHRGLHSLSFLGKAPYSNL